MNEAYDMRLVTQPKSDQINADDLIGGPITITIRDVKLQVGQDQPCSIYFDGSDKAYRPCKGMRFLLMQVWGPDAKQYIGKSLTLFRDPKVRFGADETGGVRISHMSHIEQKRVVPITMKRGIRKGWEILPLKAEVREIKPAEDAAAKWAAGFAKAVRGCNDLDALAALETKHAERLKELAEKRPELFAQASDVVAEQRQFLTPGKPDEEMGEGFNDLPAAEGAWEE